MGTQRTVASTKASVTQAAEQSAAHQVGAIVADGLRTAGRPAAVVAAMPVAGLVSHVLWGDGEALPLALTAMTGSTGLLTWMTWRFTHERGQAAVQPAAKAIEGGNRAERRRAGARARRGTLRRVHLTVSTALTLGWVELATATGVFVHPTIDIWLVGGFTGIAAWILRHHVHTGGGAGESDTWGAAWRREIAESANLAGSKLRTLTDGADSPRIEAELTLTADQKLEDVQAARGAIAHHFDVPIRAVRALPSPDTARKVKVTVVAGDLLAKTLPWPGPSAPGGSVIEPLVFGRYEDWEPGQVVLPHQSIDADSEKIAFHLLIAGMTGSGKSAAARCLIAELITRIDVVIWIADIVKKWQTFGPAAPAVDWFATEKAQAIAMVKCLPKVIAARADYLGRHGYDNWVPECGLPYLVVDLEEAAALIGDSDEFVRAAEQARSVGVTLIVSMQRPSYRVMPIEGRQQFAAALCHGVKSDADARFVLDDLVDAGANPEAWGANRPGYAYLAAPGIAEDRHIVPMRSYKIDREQLAALAEEWADRRPALDELSAAAAGDAYARRTLATAPDPANPDDDSDDVAGGWTPRRGAVVDGEVIASTYDDTSETAMRDDPQFVPPTNPDPDLADLDINAEFTAGTEAGRVAFGDGRKEPLPIEESRALLDDAIAEFEAARRTFAPRDLRRVVEQTGRTRDWLNRELKTRVDRGRIVRLDDAAGMYSAHAA